VAEPRTGLVDDKTCVNRDIVLGCASTARGNVTHGECVRCMESELSHGRTSRHDLKMATFSDRPKAEAHSVVAGECDQASSL